MKIVHIRKDKSDRVEALLVQIKKKFRNKKAKNGKK